MLRTLRDKNNTVTIESSNFVPNNIGMPLKITNIKLQNLLCFSTTLMFFD